MQSSRHPGELRCQAAECGAVLQIAPARGAGASPAFLASLVGSLGLRPSAAAAPM